MTEYKPVGVTADSKFGPRVEQRLNGDFLPQPAKNHAVVLDKVGQISLPRFPGFWVNGINYGIRNTDGIPSYRTMWTTQWSDAWSDQQIKRISDLGANVIRFIGSYGAYVDDPTGYVARVHGVFEKVRATGMKIMWSLMTATAPGGDVPVSTTNNAGYQAMVNALIGPYAGDPLILAWDACNEAHPNIYVGHKDVVRDVAGFIRAADPTALVTMGHLSSFNVAVPSNTWLDSVAAVDQYVDFHDLHFYHGANQFTNQNPLDQVRLVTKKPILIGEVGANVDPTGPGGPHVRSRLGQALYLAAFRRYVVGDCMGVIVHKISDTNTPNKFGLYDDNDATTPMLNEWAQYPTQRLTVVRDVVDAAPATILLDNFGRAASTSVVGQAVIGGAPVLTKGTWGINSNRRLAVTTSVAAGVNLLGWETRTADCVVEAEMLTNNNAATARLGLLLRAVDADNFLYLVYGHSPSTPTGTLQLFKSTAGVVSDITPPAVRGESGGVPITGNYAAVYCRLRAVMNRDTISVYIGDKIIALATGLTDYRDATIHGVAVSPADQSQSFAQIRALAGGRTF